MEGSRRAMLTVLAIAATLAVTLPDGGSARDAEGKAKSTGDDVAGRGGCPPIRIAEDYPEDIEGGCELSATGRGIDLVVKTMVGEMRFGTCDVNYTVRAESSGRTVVHQIQVRGDTPCNDADACFTDESFLPWHGRIVEDGRGNLRHELDACFDTCMGRFEGKLVLPLTRDARGWRADATTADLGTSGLELDGRWRMRPQSPQRLSILGP
jgi:hypothetical protein